MTTELEDKLPIAIGEVSKSPMQVGFATAVDVLGSKFVLFARSRDELAIVWAKILKGPLNQNKVYPVVVAQQEFTTIHE